MKKLLLILIILLFASPVWAGSPHYIDCSGSGTTGSYADPFSTVTQATAHAWADGDGLYFAEGVLCTGTTALAIDGSWTNAIIGCYETSDSDVDDCTSGEDDTGIDHEITQFGYDNGGPCSVSQGISVNKTGATIKNIRIQNVCGQCLDVQGTNFGGDSSNLTVQNVKIQNCGHGGIDARCGSTQAQCGDSQLYENVEVTGWGRRAEEGDTDGTGYRTFPAGIELEGDNSVVRNSYVYNGYGEGIAISRMCKTCLAEFNVVINTASQGIYMIAESDSIARYNLVVGLYDPDSDAASGSVSQWHMSSSSSSRTPTKYDTEGDTTTDRSFAHGIGISTDATWTITRDNWDVYGNVVIGCRECFRFDNSSDDVWDDVYIGSNLCIDNHRQMFSKGNYKEFTTVADTIIENNIFATYDTEEKRVEDLFLFDEKNSDPPTIFNFAGWTIRNNFWKVPDHSVVLGSQCTAESYYSSTECGEWDNANDESGNPQIDTQTDNYWQRFTGATADAAITAFWSSFTTDDLWLKSNSGAISNGVDSGGAATCADIDNLGINCGLIMNLTKFDWENVTSGTDPCGIGANFCATDQGDTAVEIGPWVYTEDDPELPANEASFGGGAIISGGARIGSQ